MAERNRISGHTRLVCMIGSPVAHSLSPATHNIMYEELGIDAVFLCFDVQPEDLPYVVPALTAMGCIGYNVTMPLKRSIIPYLDELSPAAQLMQAVNVVKIQDGRAIGHNTDGIGFMNNLRANGVQVEGATMTLCGPGGAGSAILTQAALDGVAELNVFARSGGNSYRAAAELIPRVAAQTSCDITLHALEDADDYAACVARSTIFANGTNVGMGEGNTQTPLPKEFHRPDLAVADVIYSPCQTQLLKDAAAIGARGFNGLGMLLHQAQAAARIWVNQDLPIETVMQRLYS